jgi:Family of unknown function (DUF5678)
LHYWAELDQTALQLSKWESILADEMTPTRRKNKNHTPQEFYSDPDDNYFKTHFAQLVRQHGGEWIVLADGKLVGVGKKKNIRSLVRKARAQHPNAIPFIAPIPTKEELECVL